MALVFHFEVFRHYFMLLLGVWFDEVSVRTLASTQSKLSPPSCTALRGKPVATPRLVEGSNHNNTVELRFSGPHAYPGPCLSESRAEIIARRV